MRSTVGLLAALLLLLCCSFTTASYEKVIACGTYNDSFYAPWMDAPLETYYVFVERWSAETSDFVRFSRYSLPDCSFESIGLQCRGAYKNVSYGLDLNETKTILVNHRRKYSVEAKLFKCQDYVRAQEPEVSEGSWSDRLSLENEGPCKSEAEWLSTSTEECGKKPTNYILGAQCGDQDQYREVIFVCDKPKNDILLDIDSEFVAAQKNNLHNIQFVLFERFKEVVEDFKEARFINQTQAVDTCRKDLIRTVDAAEDLRKTFTRAYAYAVNAIGASTEYTSRQTVLAKLKEYAKVVGDRRWTALFTVASHMVQNLPSITDQMSISEFVNVWKTTEESSSWEGWENLPWSAWELFKTLKTYDAENLLKHVEDVNNDITRTVFTRGYRIPVLEVLELFPELKEPLTAYYVEYVKDHTLGIARKHLGFLNESDAHARLIAMYQEIFRSGFDQKYMGTHSAVTSRLSVKSDETVKSYNDPRPSKTTTQEPSVREGSWSDRLSAAQWTEYVSEEQWREYMSSEIMREYISDAKWGECKSKAEWLKASTRECGKKPTNYVVGKQCGNEQKYREVTFTCDKPRIDVYTDFLEVRKDYHRKIDLAFFGRLVHIVETESPGTETYNRSIENAFTAATLPYMVPLAFGSLYAVPHFNLKSYTSRELVFAQAKEYVISFGELRYYELFRLASDILMYGNNMDTRIQQIAEFDAPNIFKNIDKYAKADGFAKQIALFPELKEPLTAYYVEYMKDHTLGIARKHLGFLNESGAHARLASMYREIFRPGFIDQKYMDKFTHSLQLEKEDLSSAIPNAA
uniref:PRKCSH_1 domain-containing protein n=1 Tax=Steinernema glaseri TaxID=37863 RepID=A0A1I8AMK3_9BILA